MKSVRTLLHFLLLGAVLVGLRRGVQAASPPEPLPLTVWIAQSATDAEARAATDEALAVEVGLSTGAAHTDQVITRRLVENLRFADRSGAAGDSESELLLRARELGMQRSDPVTRARLRALGEKSLLAQVPALKASDEQLQRYASEHRLRYARPGQVRFGHVFFDKERRGDALKQELESAGRALAGKPPSRTSAELSDPFLLGLERGLTSTNRIDADFGPGFARRLLDARPLEWSGPFTSSYGSHWVWVHEVRAGALPPLSLIRSRVARDHADDQRAVRLRRGLTELRTRYDVAVRRRAR